MLGPRRGGKNAWREFYGKEVARLWRELDMEVSPLLKRLEEKGLRIDRHMLFRIRKGEKSVSFEKILEVHRVLGQLALSEKPLTAQDLMTHDPLSLPAEMKLSDAVTSLKNRKFSQAPVLDGRGRVIGVLRLEEVVDRLLQTSQKFRPIREFVSEATKVRLNTSRRAVASVVAEQGYVLVEEGGNLRGIITYSDLIAND